MPVMTLPDGSQKTVPSGSSAKDIAESIGKRLALAAIAARVNGIVVDLSAPLLDTVEPQTLQILTERDEASLEVLRHSSAHIMARAVVRLFPNTQLAFGPPIENGFYYDIDSPTPIREEDFPQIEEEMKKSSPWPNPLNGLNGPFPKDANWYRECAKTTKSNTSMGSFINIPF